MIVVSGNTSALSAMVSANVSHGRGTRMTWQKSAACRDAQPDAFFPPEPSERVARLARDVCLSRCAVTAECGAYADREQHAGLWGGEFRAYDGEAYARHRFTDTPPLIAFEPLRHDDDDRLMIPSELAAYFGYLDPSSVRRKIIRRKFSAVAQSDDGAKLYRLGDVRAILTQLPERKTTQ